MSATHLLTEYGEFWCGETGEFFAYDPEHCTCTDCLHKAIRYYLRFASQHNRRLSQLENEIVNVPTEEE